MARRAKTTKDAHEATSEIDGANGSEDAMPMTAERSVDMQPEPAMSVPTVTAPANGNGARRGLLSRMYGDVGEEKPEERERVAAMEWQAAMAGPMELLHSSVPEASSAEDAARIWQERQGPVVPDPDGGAYIAGDAFETDARVYYRLLRRDYEKDPRPGTGPGEPYYLGKLSRRTNKSHYLPSPYGQRPGIKGW